MIHIPTALAADDEDAKLAAFFRDYLDTEFEHRPMEATRLGDHRFTHRLDDLSAKALAANRERTRRTLAELGRKIDKDKLSGAGKIDYGILEHHLKRAVWLDE